MIKGGGFHKALWPGIKKWYSKAYSNQPMAQNNNNNPVLNPTGVWWTSSSSHIISSATSITIDDMYETPITVTQKDELEALIYSLMDRVAQLEANQIPGEGGQTDYHILP